MDYELYEEMKWNIINALETKGNVKEVIQTLTNLITYATEYYED